MKLNTEEVYESPPGSATPLHGAVSIERNATSRRVPGEPGLWVFLFLDLSAFSLLFAAYVYYRGQQPDLFEKSQQALNPVLGSVNMFLLITSSLLVAAGVAGIKFYGRNMERAMIGGALACGTGFSIIKIIEYGQKSSQGLTPLTNDFFMHYYVLTGIHWIHLMIGMGILIFFYLRVRASPKTSIGRTFLEGGACYWHMVDLVWIVLFPLLYLLK